MTDIEASIDYPEYDVEEVTNEKAIQKLDEAEAKLKKLEESKTSKQIVECIKNLYKPSYYSEYNLGHNGLNLSSYSHVTIPIRNYASLVSQRLEIDYLINKNFS